MSVAEFLNAFKAAALVWLLLLPTGCGGDSREADASAKPKVTVVEAREVKIPRKTDFSGLLAAGATAEVRAGIGGRLAEKLFEEGAVVQAGQPLYRLDDHDLKAALAAARTDAAQAEDVWQKEDVVRKRLDALADKGAISLKRRDEAALRAEEALNAYQAARAEEEKAAFNLERAVVTAPIAGLIARPNVEAGDDVEAESLMAVIYGIDPIRADFSVAGQDYARMKQIIRENRGRPEALALTLLPGRAGTPYKYDGVLETGDSAADSQTGPVAARAKFPNPEHALRPGMQVTLTAITGELAAITVPEAAVVDRDGSPAVYAVDDQDQVEAVSVKVGDPLGGDRIILEGLAPGRRVVVEGAAAIRPGLTVEVKGEDAAVKRK